MKGVKLLILLCFLSIATKENNYPTVLEDSRVSNFVILDIRYKNLAKYLESIDSPLSADTIWLYSKRFGCSLELALSVGYLETQLGTCKTGRHLKNKTAWSVGEWDSGSKRKYRTYNSSVKPFFKLITEDYLKEKSERQLIYNFVNYNGCRYASSPTYEVRIQSLYKHFSEILNRQT